MSCRREGKSLKMTTIKTTAKDRWKVRKEEREGSKITHGEATKNKDKHDRTENHTPIIQVCCYPEVGQKKSICT